MGTDAQNQRCVAALWRLVEAARSRARAEIDGAAAEAAAALATAMGAEPYLLLHENGGRVFVDGHMVSLDVDVFLATRGLASRMQARAVGEVLFQGGVDGEDLAAWAQTFVAEGFLGPRDGRIHVGVRAPAAEPTFQLGRQRASVDAQDSRLRAVYLESQLVGLVDEHLVPLGVARCALHGVVDFLLSVPGGLEPLTLLQRQPSALARALHVAVVTVQLASLAGWPQSRLGELGAVALVHDVGSVLDRQRPAAAGTFWLLERGTEEFWLRSACVAAGWRDRAADDGLAAELLATELVRLAVAHCDGATPRPGGDALLGELAAAGAAALAAAAAHS